MDKYEKNKENVILKFNDEDNLESEKTKRAEIVFNRFIISACITVSMVSVLSFLSLFVGNIGIWGVLFNISVIVFIFVLNMTVLEFLRSINRRIDRFFIKLFPLSYNRKNHQKDNFVKFENQDNYNMEKFIYELIKTDISKGIDRHNESVNKLLNDIRSQQTSK